MQTKKRAKPVKFGKKETPKEEHHASSHKAAPPIEEKPKKSPEENETRVEIETVSTEVAVIPDEPEEKEKVASHEEPKVTETQEPVKEEGNKEDEETVISSDDEEISFDEKELEEEKPQHEKSAFTSDNYEEKREGKGNYFLYFLIVAFVSFFIGLVCMAGIDYLVSSKSVDINSFLTAPTATPAPSKQVATPTLTPVATEVDLSKYKIQVLNGSGIKGEAAKLRQELIAEGFTVSSSGNADSQDYETTQLTVKKDVNAAYVTKLKEVLKKSYTLEDASSVPATSQTVDVVIIIGKE